MATTGTVSTTAVTSRWRSAVPAASWADAGSGSRADGVACDAGGGVRRGFRRRAGAAAV